MKKYLKLIAAILAVVGVVMMFLTQVTIEWNSGLKEAIGLHALIGGTYTKGIVKGSTFNGVGTGLAGYILLGAGALILLLAALVPYFKEHDILSAVVTGAAVVCLIIGVVFIFLIRKNFSTANADQYKTVYVGWAAMVAGGCGSLAALFGGLGLIFDLADNA